MRHVPIATECCNAERINITKDCYLHTLCSVVAVIVRMSSEGQSLVLTSTLVSHRCKHFSSTGVTDVHESLSYCKHAQNVLIELKWFVLRLWHGMKDGAKNSKHFVVAAWLIELFAGSLNCLILIYGTVGQIRISRCHHDLWQLLMDLM